MQEIKFTKELLYKLQSIYAKDGLTKVYDKDIAKALGMSPAQFSESKKNGKIPLKYIIPYCIKNNVSVNWVFDSSRTLCNFKESTQYLIDWTECRADFLSRIKGKLSGKCDPVQTITLKSPLKAEITEKEYEKLLKFLKKKDCNSDLNIDFFSSNYERTRLSRYGNFITCLLWIIISGVIGFYLGAQSKEKPIYEQKIKELENKNEKIKKELFKINKKVKYF